MTDLDSRLNAFRPDLADIRLDGKVDSERFIAPVQARISRPVAALRKAPDHGAGVDSELLFGDSVNVFERKRGWAWVQSGFDGYVGYVDETALATALAKPTHVVAVPRTFVYPHAELKSPNLMALSMGSGVAVTAHDDVRGTRYATIATGGHVIAKHLQPIDEPLEDYVAIAELFAGTPYLWGGTSAFGLDCSGLVQLSKRMCGEMVLRDTDMQETSIGDPIDPSGGLQRGDLVFWKGHVAIMRDNNTVIHANGHLMLTSSEPLAEAVKRIGYLYDQPTGWRRPACDSSS